MVARAFFDTIRSIAFGGISGSYASLGSTFTKNARAIKIVNNTDGDLMFTDDVTLDKIFIPAYGFDLWDIQANMNAQFDDKFVLEIGTQISVKQVTAPSVGNVYLTVLY